MRKVDERSARDLTKLMTMSISDLLDEFFKSEQMKGLLAFSGIIGSWAGPRSPGSAFIMAHHQIGDNSGGIWGFAEGGMGGFTQALLQSALSNGVDVMTGIGVEQVLVKDGTARGVALENGWEIPTNIVISTVHPKITFLNFLERDDLPEEFLNSIEKWKTRSGTVKINLALDKLPEFACKPGFDPAIHGGTIILSESVDEMEMAYQDAALNKIGAMCPVADICIPSVFDKTLAPEGKHVMSIFAQWVPQEWSHTNNKIGMNDFVRNMLNRLEEVAPGFQDTIIEKKVIGPHEMEHEYGLIGGNIFHGEMTGDQIFHMRLPGYADTTTPIEGLYNASSATHGGGGVTCVPAVNVVKKIL